MNFFKRWLNNGVKITTLIEVV